MLWGRLERLDEQLVSLRRRDYEYRSKKTLWGVPLVHVRFAANGIGIARGILAIGDGAVGLVAIGSAAFGGIALGGMSIGLIGLGGMTLGLLVGLGGVAASGLAVGLAAVGGEARSFFQLSAGGVEQIGVLAWAVGTAATIAAAVGAVFAWLTSTGGPARD